MLITILLLIVGFAVLIKGADLLVDGSSSLAKRMRISEIVIGLTVVAFGTSTPELVVNVLSSLKGNSEIVLGNIIGSNIFNLFLILGIAALIFPLKVKRNSVLKEIPYSLLAVAALYVLANDFLGSKTHQTYLSRLDGIILLVFFAIFIFYTFGISRIGSSHTDEIKIMPLWQIWLFIGLGFAGLFLGGKLVVDNAVEIARMFGVSDKLIALTIVAAGTSLPELAASSVAAYKKRCDIAVGNVIGSNIFNIFFILGISSTINPVSYNTVFNLDVLVLGVGTAFLVLSMFTGKKHRLDRWEAIGLIIFYVAYTIYIIQRS